MRSRKLGRCVLIGGGIYSGHLQERGVCCLGYLPRMPLHGDRDSARTLLASPVLKGVKASLLPPSIRRARQTLCVGCVLRSPVNMSCEGQQWTDFA